MPNIRIDLPRVHMAGSDAHHDAHLELGQHGFALYLSPDATYPLVDMMERRPNWMTSYAR